MKIKQVVTASYLRDKSREVYESVASGCIAEVTNRSREPMVLMTKADFLEMAKQANGDN